MIEFLIAALLMGLSALSDQAPDNLIVLQADPDGKVGQVVVTQGAETRRLDSADTGVGFDRGGSLGSVRSYSQDRIEQIFASALAAQPEPPKSYLLYFQTGSNELDAAAQDALTQALADIAERKQVRVAVIGHTDRVGAAQVNARLALARVESVRAALTAAGISDAVITSLSHGEYDPLVPTADEVAEPRNRRVEIVVR